jgi:hypothetical protein
MIDREKFVQLRSEIIADRGELTLFALFLRGEVDDRWDLLVAAPWVDDDEAGALRYLSRKVAAKLSEREIIELSRIVLIEQNHPGLKELLRETVVEDGIVRQIENLEFAGLSLRRAIIFEANPEALASSRRRVASR